MRLEIDREIGNEPRRKSHNPIQDHRRGSPLPHILFQAGPMENGMKLIMNKIKVQTQQLHTNLRRWHLDWSLWLGVLKLHRSSWRRARRARWDIFLGFWDGITAAGTLDLAG
jgi:hypothetical protein